MVSAAPGRRLGMLSQGAPQNKTTDNHEAGHWHKDVIR